MRLVRAGIHFYIVGILILTFGIALTILSMMGTSPYDSLLVGLNRTFGFTVGTWEVVLGLSLLIFNAIAEKRRPELFAMITSVITGIGIDSWLFLLENVVIPEAWAGEFGYYLLGLLFTCLGTACYLQSSIAPNPLDRAMLVVTNLTGLSVTYSRSLISIVLVILAFFFDGAIGLGTLINALFSGLIISLFLPYFESLHHRLHRRLERVS
ncbi:YczE/YyaS/YitT family protein [Lentibacillus kimchii]|uniref:YitT family protein n=1 Tax=Lentibacillus kimchii TaxID=1542911 RepID=A0ABW2US99_9BACI